jgi:hypothetical protein
MAPFQMNVNHSFEKRLHKDERQFKRCRDPPRFVSGSKSIKKLADHEAQGVACL